MEQLLGMGFPEHQCKKALAEAGNVDGAVSFIFANADKPDEFWLEAPAAEPASDGADGAAGAADAAPLADPAGARPSAAALEAELPAVLGELRAVEVVASEAVKDPAVLAEMVHGAAGVDTDRVVQTITGQPPPKRFAAEGPTAEEAAAGAVEYFLSALTGRWGEYVVKLEPREIVLVASDARRMARRGSVTDAGALEAKCGELAKLASRDGPQALRECLATEEGAALARDIVLLDGGDLPAPEPASESPRPKRKEGKKSKAPEPETQGSLSIEVGGSETPLPFCVAEFGASRAELHAAAVVQTAPAQAEADLTNADALAGQIAYCVRGEVPFVAKARRAQAVGAAALVVANGGKDDSDVLFGMGGADDDEEPITIPVIGVGAADGERILEAGVLSLQFDWNPHRLVLLNEHFKVESYDGGQETAETAVENVLVPKLKPFHCSKPGLGHTLSLRCDDPGVVVTHVVVHAAANCSEPLRRGEIWVAKAAQPAEPLCEDGVCRLPTADEGIAPAPPRVAFECPKESMQFVHSLPQPTSGAVTIGLKFLDTHSEGANVDVGMVAIVGRKTPEAREALDTAAASADGLGPVPRDLKCTNLIRHVQRKKWLPLESDPGILTQYLHRIGFPQTHCFHDIPAFEDWAVDMVPTPVLAVVLLFPVTEETEAARRAEREAIAAGGQKLPGEGQPPLLHIQQNIGNACGTIGLLHAACHAVVGGDVAAPPADSWLGKFISHTGGLSAEAAGEVLEDDVEIEDAHAAVRPSALLFTPAAPSSSCRA